MTSASDRLQGLDAELHLLKLRFETSKAHDGIRDTATARFRYHLCRLFSEEGIPLQHAELMNRSFAEFSSAVAAMCRTEAVERRYRLCHSIFSREQSENALRRLEPMLRQAAVILATGLRRLFREHAETLAHRRLLRTISSLGLKNAGRAYADDVASRTARHQEALDKAFVAYFRSKHGLDLVAGESGGTDDQASFVVNDAFGRGLMQAVDESVGIRPWAEQGRYSRGFFPREFCAPVLGVLRHMVFGVEKYQRINEKLLLGVNTACRQGERHCRERLRVFYGEERVSRYLAGFELYVLKILQSDVRRAHFVASVDLLTRRGNSSAPEFTEVSLSVLLGAWIRHVQANLHLLHVEKGTRRILSWYADRISLGGPPR